jgi:hypothetical protein
MALAVYPALTWGDASAGYRAVLVDFEEASLTAATASDLLKAARAEVSEALARADRDGRDWPQPTPIEALTARQQAEGGALLLVDVQVEDAPVRVNISLGERLLRRLDEAAEAQNMTRSGFISAAVRERLGEAGPGWRPGAGSQRMHEDLSELGRRLNEAFGPDSTVGRTLADLDARALEGLRGLAERFAAGSRRGGERGPTGPGSDRP